MEKIKPVTPFLKWAGGKRWLTPHLRTVFQNFKGRYFEPFLGSGAVFFEFLPNSGTLSDTNESLIECYAAIRQHPDAVSAELRSLSSLDPDFHYYNVRASSPTTAFARAARFLYLNRTCWNGLYRVNREGYFNVPRGTKTAIELPGDDFRLVAEALGQMDIVSCDFEIAIDKASTGDLVFCDPPYTVAHNMNGFIKYNQTLFSWKDQQRLARCLGAASRRGAIVVATNADHVDVRDLYADFGPLRSMSRASVIAGSTSGRRQTSELLITNSVAGKMLGGLSK